MLYFIIGGSIIAGFDTDFVRKVAQNYPGRASSSPTIDVFITLMQMGTAGYKALMDERRENYKLLKEEMTKVAEKYGERVLETRNNPISIGKSKSMPYMKLGHLKKYFFQILWKSRCNILVSFPSHLKKLRSILRF